MNSQPWNSREGQYDRPSSSLPLRTASVMFAPTGDTLATRKPKSYVDQQLADAVRLGVVATATDSILERIDAAIAKLHEDGHGSAKVIYLTDSDMLAFRVANGEGPDVYRDLPVRIGSHAHGSKVYSRYGIARAVRRPRKAGRK